MRPGSLRAWLRTSTATERASQWKAAVQGTPCLLGSVLPLLLLLSLFSHQPAQAQVPGTSGIESLLADPDGDGQPDRLLEAVTVTGVLAADFSQGPGYSQTHVQDSQRGIELLLLDQVPPELEAIIGTGAQTQPLSPQAYAAGDVVRARGQLIETENRIQLLVTGMERVGRVAPPAPRETTVEELLAGRHQDVLVTVSGRLVATPEGPEQARLVGDSGSIPVRIGADLMADAAFGPRLSEGAAMTLTGFAEPLRRGGALQYRLAIDGRSDFIVQPRPPFGSIAIGAVVGLLLLALVYMAGRRGIAERRGREMEAMISRLEEAQETLKQSERALRSSEVQYRSLIEHAPFGVFRTGPKGKIILANRALADMLGFDSPSDVDGLELGADLFENEWDWVTLESSLRSRGGSPVVDARWRHRNGSVLSVRVGLHLVADPDGGTETLEGFVEDVTERQRLEEQLRQSQKMQAVGQLAGGIAHDFNNLLTVILGSCQLLLVDTMEDEARAELEEMQVAANRAATLTRQLLAFSKQQPLAPQVLDLNEAVESALELLRRVVGEDVRLVTNLNAETGAVRVDPGQFQQVIMNLVVNARDAMSRGGTIEIRTEPASGDDELLRLHPDATAEDYALLSVADDGEGMDPSTLERVFEPFFTTKETGKGTGLGLATVYGIVAQSGGDIRAESEVGIGTTFKVFLPTADGTPEPTTDDFFSASTGRLGTADPAASSETRSGHVAPMPGVRETDA